jgi:hypothetical protein
MIALDFMSLYLLGETIDDLTILPTMLKRTPALPEPKNNISDSDLEADFSELFKTTYQYYRRHVKTVTVLFSDNHKAVLTPKDTNVFYRRNLRSCIDVLVGGIILPKKIGIYRNGNKGRHYKLFESSCPIGDIELEKQPEQKTLLKISKKLTDFCEASP